MSISVCAALFHAPKAPLVVETVELDPPGPDEVLVEVGAAGVCGSDLHVLRGEWKRPVPMILGHEAAGTVAATGREVRDVDVGDRVVVSWAPACGSCRPCRRGDPTVCTAVRAAINAGTRLDGTTGTRFEGAPVYRMTTVGAFAERVVLPRTAVVRLPDEISLDEAAVLGCAALTGAGAAREVAQIAPGARVIVIGAGGVGIFAVQGARAAGAREVVAVDPHAARRAEALAAGADRAVAPAEVDEIIHGWGEGADCVIEAVGAPDTQRLAADAIRPGGRAVLVGMPGAVRDLALDSADLVTNQKTIVGSMYGSVAPEVGLERMMAAVLAGELDVASHIGPTFPLSQVNDAVAAASSGASGRVLVKPQADGGS